MPKKEKGTTLTSKYNGVSKNARARKFSAQYKYKGKSTYLGLYTTEEQAAIVYDNAIYALKQEVGKTAHTYNFGDPTDPYTKIAREAALAQVPTEILTAPQARKKFRQYHNVSEDTDVLVKISGISWYAERQMWKMSIQIDRHKYYLGRADTYASAVQKYLQSLKEFRVRFPDNENITIKINTIEEALRTNTLYYKQPGEVEPYTQTNHDDIQHNNHVEASLIGQWAAEIINFYEQANNSPQDTYTELLPPLSTPPPPPLIRRTPDQEQETDADIFGAIGANSDSMFFLWDNPGSNTPRLNSTSPVITREETFEEPFEEQLTDIDRLLQFQL